MGNFYVDWVVVKTVKILLYSLVGGCEAGIGAVGRKDLVVANTRQDIVEAAELLAAVYEIVLDSLAREGVEVGLINVFLTTSE